MADYFYYIDDQGYKHYYHFLGLDENKVVGEHIKLGDVHEFEFDDVVFLMALWEDFEEIN